MRDIKELCKGSIKILLKDQTKEQGKNHILQVHSPQQMDAVPGAKKAYM